jgi:hypothetical protein
MKVMDTNSEAGKLSMNTNSDSICALMKREVPVVPLDSEYY